MPARRHAQDAERGNVGLNELLGRWPTENDMSNYVIPKHQLDALIDVWRNMIPPKEDGIQSASDCADDLQVLLDSTPAA